MKRSQLPVEGGFLSHKYSLKVVGHPHMAPITALCFPPGVASVVVSFFLAIYYNIINAWGFWYFFNSFQVRQRASGNKCRASA